MKTPHQSINEALKRVYEDVSERELMKLYPSEYNDFYQAACGNGCEHQEAHEEAIMGLQDWHKDRESERNRESHENTSSVDLQRPQKSFRTRF